MRSARVEKKERHATLGHAWDDDVLVRREDPLAVLQLLLQRSRRLVKLGGQPFECGHGVEVAQEAKMGYEDRVRRKLLGHGIHIAEPFVARGKEDVVSAAVPLPEVGHGALQVVRSRCHICLRAAGVAGLAEECEGRHKEEVSRVWV